MLTILVFVLLSYGISNIIIYGSIFESWRKFWLEHNPSFMGKLFTCMMCLPTWVGFLLSLMLFSPIDTLFHVQDFGLWKLTIPKQYVSMFFDGCFASSCTWLTHTIQEAFERHHKK